MVCGIQGERGGLLLSEPVYLYTYPVISLVEYECKRPVLKHRDLRLNVGLIMQRCKILGVLRTLILRYNLFYLLDSFVL